MAAQYQFRPLVEGDLPMVRQWLQVPEVARWWGDPVEQFGLVSGDMGEPAMDQYIVSSTQAFGAPFGYLQCYRLTDWNICFGSQPEHTRGIDQMIGAPEMIGRGHGPAFIRAFVELQTAPAVAQRDCDGALGIVLPDDEAVELGNDLARRKIGHASRTIRSDRPSGVSTSLSRTNPAFS